ncbi:MAG: WYL domain-containing protein [Actinomycetota bacterium]|nr:WYL domain-containing protein [Actinomycetota bacterium]
MRRIERLINLIAALLEAERPMTADDIRTSIQGYDQDSLEAFRRAFERDKADLKAVGIPIEMVEDTWGGTFSYTIPKERYYLPELDLEADELAALRIAAGALLGVEEAASAGMTKIAAASRDEPWAGGRLSWNADLAASEPLLGPLYEAVSDRRPVRFRYLSAGSDEERERLIEPYTLVHRRGHWYLVGRDPTMDQMRTFKVARIVGDVVVETGSFEPPQGFDPRTHVGTDEWIPSEEVPELATVRFSERVAWWARQSMPPGRVRDAPEGAVDVEVPIASLDAIVSFVVWWADDVEVLSPPAARTRLIERLTRAATT